MSWIQIEKRRLGAQMPNDTLRLHRRRLSVAGNVAENFQANRKTRPNGQEVVKLGLAVDPTKHRIQLVPNAVSGFTFSTPSGGAGTAMSVGLPAAMKEMQPAIGDYKLIDRDQLIFELAR